MRWIFVGVLAVHGLIHSMGFAKAFGYADLPQLTLPVSPTIGLLWLVSAVLIVATAVLFGLGLPPCWIAGAAGLVLSQTLIVLTWRDAWAGTFANALLLVVVAHGFLTEGPWSFHARYLREARAGLARVGRVGTISESDLAPLPATVQHYLRQVGVVGQPHVQNYRVRFTGRIRSAPDAAWMPFKAEQQSFTDSPTRLFLMRARMYGIPVEAFHRLADGHATMEVKLAGLVPITNARGDEMDRAESVTLFNDMCLLAPGTLIDPTIVWQTVDAVTARARFTHGRHQITATLTFDDEGRLVNFESDDRVRVMPDGSSTPLRFSTPLRDYRPFGPLRLGGFGEARWRLPGGEFTYGEFTMQDVVMNAPIP
jgi:hypothetical protein